MSGRRSRLSAAALLAAVGAQPAQAGQVTTVGSPQATFEWHVVTSEDGRLSVDLPCNPHHRRGHSRVRGIEKPVEAEELWCLKSTGFAATGGSATFDIYRSWVAGDPALTQRAFELGVAARGGGIKLAAFPSDHVFWSTDTIMTMTRQRVGCKWGMEFVRDGFWWTAIVETPWKLCGGIYRATPSETALHFFNSMRVAAQ